MAFGLIHDPQNQESYGQGLAAIILLILTWPTLLIRLYVRAFLVKRLWWDDSLMVLAQILFTAYVVAVYKSIVILQGVRSPTYEQLVLEMQWHLSLIICYIVCTWALKLSLCFFFLRILHRQLERLITYVTIGCVTFINFGEFWFYLFSCGNPHDYAANMIQGHCVSHRVYIAGLFIQFGWNLLADIIIVLLPMPATWASRMNSRAKASVTLIFILAGSGMACSLLRVYTLKKLVPENGSDTEYHGAIYSILEPGIFIIAGCLATMRPLIPKIEIRSLLSKIRNMSGVSGSSNQSKINDLA